MNPQQRRKIRHRHQQQKYRKQAAKTKQRLQTEVYNHQHQDDRYAKPVMFRADANYLNDGDYIHDLRNDVLEYAANHQASNAHFRTKLNEYSTVRITGIVTDVVQEKGRPPKPQNRYHILIDHPMIVSVIFKGEKYERDINRPLDSHIWIYADEVFMTGNQSFITDPTISIADTIQFVAHVHPYRGRVNGIRTTRFGLNDISIIACGIAIPDKDPNKTKIRSTFNRHGDWVLKFHGLPSAQQLKNYLDQHHKAPNKKITITYRPSKYPSYQERLNLKSNNDTNSVKKEG